MADLDRPSFPKLASLDIRSAREFCSLGTWTRSNVEKVDLKIYTYLRYEASYGALASYSPVTFLVTSNESLFTSKLWAPNSLARNIPTIKASYSAWLLLALNANLRACSIKSSLVPSKMTPAPLPYWFKDPSTERTQQKPSASGWESSDESSTMKSSYT